MRLSWWKNTKNPWRGRGRRQMPCRLSRAACGEYLAFNPHHHEGIMDTTSLGTASDPIRISDDSTAGMKSKPMPTSLPSKPVAPARTEPSNPNKRPRKPKPPPEPVRLNELHAPWLDSIPSSSRTSAERCVVILSILGEGGLMLI